MNRRHLTIAASAALCAAAGPVRADFIWDGGGADDLWTTDGNWAPDGAPGLNVADDLVFASTGGLAQSPDAGADDWLGITGISFTGADALLTLIGTGSLTLADGAAILNDSAFLQTIAIDLVASGSSLVIDAMAGDLVLDGDIDLDSGADLTVQGAFATTLNGTITGSGGLLLDTTGTVTVTGTNEYTGGTTVTGGTVVAGNDEAFGLFGITLDGDVALESDDDARILANNMNLDGNTLTISGANDLELGGIIFGVGGITVDTSGSLELSGVNGFSGDVMLNQGTIVLGGDGALSSGDLVLTGNGSIRSDNDERRIFNDVELGANDLTFAGNRDLALLGVIDGTGSLIVDANASLSLFGANTYDGGTILDRGTIILGNNSALGTGTLTLTGNGALESTFSGRTIDNDIDLDSFELSITGDLGLTLDGILSGTGGFTVDVGDAATVTLTGANTYTGATTVDDGTLVLDGSITSAVSVLSGGTFTGDGSMVGDLTVANGGTYNPGVDIGTMTVDGTFDLQSGGTLQVELDADTLDADLLDLTGTATLAAGSTVAASLSGAAFLADGQTFTIIDADAGVTDLGAMIEGLSATVAVSLSVDDGFVNGDSTYALQINRAADAYSAAATGANNRAIGSALDALIATAEGDPTGETASLLGQLDGFAVADYDEALDQLSPERHNAMVTVAFDATSAFTSTQMAYLSTRRGGVEAWSQWLWSERMQPGSLASARPSAEVMAAALREFDDGLDDEDDDGFPEGLDPAPMQQPTGRWGRIYGVFAEQDSSPDRTGYDADSFGGQFGFDRRIDENTVLGLAIGYAHTDLDAEGDRGNQSDDTVRLGPYLSLQLDDWYVDASASFAYHFLDGERNLPALDLTTQADYDGLEFSGYLGAGYRHELRRNVYLVPSVSALYTWLDYDGFTETGGGAANLRVDRRDADSLRSRIGLSVMGTIDVGMKFLPSAYVGWEHEFLEDDGVEASFTDGGTPFAIGTGARDEDSVFFGFALSALFTSNASMFVRYEREIGDERDVAAIAGGVLITY